MMALLVMQIFLGNEIIDNVFSIMAAYIPIKDPTNEKAHFSVIQVCSSEHTTLPSGYSTNIQDTIIRFSYSSISPVHCLNFGYFCLDAQLSVILIFQLMVPTLGN